MSLLPPLAAPQDVAAVLDDPRIRVFDTTVVLDRPAGGGPYTPRPQREAYRAERLPGAAFADLVTELADVDAPYPFALPSPDAFAAAAGTLGIGDDVHVVAYAHGASPMWATRLWWLLRFFGFDAVTVVDGGLAAWKAAGLPVASGEHAHPPATFTPRPRPELLATRTDVEAIVADGASCLLNALPPRVFRGEGPSSYSRPGRIPGSVSVPSASLLDDVGRFQPVSALRDALAAGGVPADRPVVAYCGGGISATVDVFALTLLGRDDVRLYDGSLTEWTADPTLPVEVD